VKRSRGLGRRNACPSGKRRWHDHAEAAEAVSRMKARAERDGRPYREGRVYQCPMCQGWHVSSQLTRTSVEPARPLRPPRTATRQRKPIPQRSAKRRTAMRAERVPFVLSVLERRPWCEAQLPWCCTGRSTDVNELMRGAYRTLCWLDDDRVTSLCGGCHRWVTLHPAWAAAHGQQVEYCAVGLDEAFATAAHLRGTLGCAADCEEDHRP
jgi:hypothetical protein